ncbi:TetR/AcrR family transcriptional regulator [Kribbella sp. CA-253562]|uniref:TetR/AcrR family transcriptional regulator n=1 Tax=Kribbella sp. CA-253562 TaxID=3239942 RepID=UPI003D92E561
MTSGTGRRYTSTRRALQAAQTRAEIIAAATRLFESKGWKGTTIAGVAAEAGVAVDTIYAGFKSKSQLLAAAKDAVRDGARGETPLFERPGFRDLGQGDRSTRLRLAADLIAAVNDRTRAIDAVWREAAASDAQIALLLSEREAGRRGALQHGFSLMLGTAPPDCVVDGLWAITSPEVYSKLVDGRGWSREVYRDWLAESLDRLLPEGQPQSANGQGENSENSTGSR